MNFPKWIKPFFIIAALYDGILGILFLIIPMQIFNIAKITPPNHIGYVQFPAALLIVFSIMFFNIAKDPKANRNLILYGMLLKLSYCSVVFFHWIGGNIPFIWVLFGFFDLAFLIMFIAVYRMVRETV